jgi:DNA polymerase-3 subunit alpha
VTKDFVHLHNHFDIGSLLDGHMRPAEGIAAAKKLGMKALGISDHGFCHGHYQFHADALAAEIQPINGCELYVAPSGPDGEPSDRTVKRPIKWRKRAAVSNDAVPEGGKDVAGNGKYTHQTVWAMNAVGLRGLWTIIAEATRTGVYGKASNPRVDHNLIRQYASGLIATTGCPSGEVATRLRLGQMDLAQAAIERDLEIYGAENYFLEVMDHGIGVEKEIRDGLLQLMRRYDLRPLVTNDAHYATPDKAEAHDALICVQTGGSLDNPARFKFDGDSYSLRPAEEMHALFEDTPFAAGLHNTLLVAEMASVPDKPSAYLECFEFKNRMPVYPVPDGMDSFDFLWQLVREGLAKRYRGDALVKATERAEYEMRMIKNPERGIDFTDYLLVLWDFCGFMRREGVLFGPRGSAGGSVVLYALFVAAVDPIRFGLAFERFINPDRVSPPDVDIDISDLDRPKVIAYLKQMYGDDHVAANITFGYIGGKAALKDAARVTDQPVHVGEALTKRFPPALFGKSLWLADKDNPDHARNQEGDIWKEFDELADATAENRRIVSVARGIERRVRSTGVHACAVIVSSEPLWGVVPLQYLKDGDHKHVCFEYKHIEAMGLQKLDALGLRNWRVLGRCLSWVRELHGVDIDLDDESFDDPAVYQLLAKGHTLGVFQLESGGMQKLLRAMRPDRFDDIMAVGALYRPGPMGMGAHEAYARRKTGLEPVTPIHPELKDALEPILGSTYGLLTFQEQVMAAVQAVGGFTPGQADLLRKAMGKKDKAYMDAKRVDYYDGAAARGFSREAADALWSTIEPFADYAFNKSHTASYGRLGYWTAWFKAHYPVIFMAATLDAEAGDKKKLAVYLAECRRMGITVTVPDINESTAEFTPTADGRIRFGLAGVRSVGDGAAEAILSGRAQGGPYRDFIDFLERAGEAACTKVAIEGLAEAGAFDMIEPNRRVVFCAAAHAAKAAATAKKRLRKDGAVDLFTGQLEGAAADQISLIGLQIDRSLSPFERIDQLDRERERLGLYLSGHPLDGTESVLGANRTESTAELIMREPRDGDTVVLSGMIMSVEKKHRRSDGKPMAAVILEDLYGSVEVMVFAKKYEEFGEHLGVGKVVAMKVRLWVKAAAGGDDLVDDGTQPDDATVTEVDITYNGVDMKILEAPDPNRPLVVWVRLDRVTKEDIETLRRACELNPGDQVFQFAAAHADWTPHGWKSAPMKVNMDARLQSEVKAILGRSAFLYTPETAAAARRR